MKGRQMTEQTNIPSQATWAIVLERFKSAKAASETYARDHWLAAGTDAPQEVDDTMDRLAGDFSDAQSDLMATPAPDLEALSHKLDVAMRLENGDDPTMTAWEPEFLAQIIADYRRLLTPGPVLQAA